MTLPSYYIPGMMAPPAQKIVNSNRRRKLRVAVFARLSQRNLVLILPGSEFEGMPAGVQPAEDGKSWSGKVFLQQLKKYAKKRYPAGYGGNQKWTLVCDRDPAHTAKITKATLPVLGIHNVLLPPSGADLDPLDYGIIGTVKRQWGQLYAEKRWDWDTACRKFVEMLEQVDAGPTIRALPGRMKACIEADGWHFEYSYRKGHTVRMKNAK